MEELAINVAVPFVLVFLMNEDLVDVIILSCAKATLHTANNIQITRVMAAAFRNVLLLMGNLLTRDGF